MIITFTKNRWYQGFLSEENIIDQQNDLTF